MAGNVVSQVNGYVCREVVGCHKKPVMQLSCFIALLRNVPGIRKKSSKKIQGSQSNHIFENCDFGGYDLSQIYIFVVLHRSSFHIGILRHGIPTVSVKAYLDLSILFIQYPFCIS